MEGVGIVRVGLPRRLSRAARAVGCSLGAVLRSEAGCMDDVQRLAGLAGIGLGFFASLFLLHVAGAGSWAPAWPQRVLAVVAGVLWACMLAGAVVSLLRTLKGRC